MSKVVYHLVCLGLFMSLNTFANDKSNTPSAGISASHCRNLLTTLNETYVHLHRAKEDAFWGQKMGLSNYVDGTFERAETELQNYVSDPAQIALVRAELDRKDLTERERVGLEGWLRLFETRTIADPRALAEQNKLIEMEGRLNLARRDMSVGYTDAATGQFVKGSTKKLQLVIQTDDNEANRRSAFENLRELEKQILDAGFIEVVKQRNHLARILGYSDYYEFKVQRTEGMSKAELFRYLDGLEADSREAAERSLKDASERLGKGIYEPWNFAYLTSGTLTQKVDPYFPFEKSFDVWTRSFAAMNINYNKASIHIDLVDRAKKYSNGFMHGPFPQYVTEDGTVLPAEINFSANAIPGQVGSGQVALKTFVHEGGHAAHFSNIFMPSPAYSQEFAPTSVAMAETQSMFLDSLIKDADWQMRYAKTADGRTMPRELLVEQALNEHEFLARTLRAMLVVPYAEKALYEMRDEELTPENILAIFRDVERRMLFNRHGSGTPTLAIPHLLSGESSAYYHGYILARMAVFQTRAYFMKKYGYIMDNPNIGPELAANYWREGNARTFAQFVESLTGEPFSARATLAEVNMTREQVIAEVDEGIARESKIPVFSGELDLNAQIYVDHGDDRIASTENGVSLSEVSRRFEEWVRSL